VQINPEQLTTGEDFTYLVKQYDQARFTSPRHYHFEYELAYLKAGSGKLFVGNAIHSFAAGHLFLFGPSLVHAFKNEVSPTGEKASCQVILFKPDFFGEKFLQRPEALSLRKLLEEAKGGLQFINPGSEILICLQRLAQSTTLSGVQAFLRLLQLLADHSARKAMTRKWFNKHYYVQDDAKIRRVLDHVHAHLKEITFGQAATYTGLSNSSFARFFKTKTDRTFSEYVNEARIKHAQDLLIGTAQPIREVSQACGFDNLSYFNRVFKKLNQRTPAEYRNHFR